MLKKTLLFAGLMTAGVVCAQANVAPYMGLGLGVLTNTSTKYNQNQQAANYRGVPINVFVGYAGLFAQQFYLAAELGGTLGTMTLSSKNHLNTSYGYQASLIPGFMLNDAVLAFSRIGFVGTHFSSLNQTSHGGEVGLGLQTNLTQHLNLRGEYDYCSYSDVKGMQSPQSDAFNISLIYQFD